MSKYIKLDDAIDEKCPVEDIWEDCIDCPLNNSGIETCKMGKWLKSLPTTEIVRCKDCKHYNSETHGCKRNPSVEGWLKDDFCSYAEKQVASKLEIVDTPTDSPTNAPTDLISRQEAIEALTGWQTDPTDDEIEHTLKALPPEEPQRPKGEWIEYIDDRNGRRYVKCSSCNKSTLNAIEYDVLDGERHTMNYCPNCGAKMKGGTENE